MPDHAPLTFAEMLRQEYEHFHGDSPPLYLKDAGRFARLLHAAPAGDEAADYVKGALSHEARKELTDGWRDEQEPTGRLRSELTARFNALLRDERLRASARLDEALVSAGLMERGEARPDLARLSESGLMRVNAHLLNLLFPGAVAALEPADGGGLSASEVVKVLHHAQHSALCLSGGGIRSATFNLGILQGLARHGLLERFDYLSTVSGGGFIGGWLSAWIHRHERGLRGVVDELSDPPPADRVLEPDPKALSWLRTYSNYLSPKLGLLNADTWALVAMVLRNMLLNWLVFVPWLVAALLVPRLWVAFVNETPVGPSARGCLVVGLLAGVVFLTFVSLNLPSAHPTDRSDASRGQGRGQRAFLLFHLLPLVVSAASLTTYWARITPAERAGLDGGDFALFAGAMVVIPWLVAAGYIIAHAENKLTALLIKFPVATLAIAIGLILTGFATRAAAGLVQPPDIGPNADPRLYATLAVPALVLLLSLGGTLLAGFTSRFTGDEDQEWWSRAGAWMIIVVIAWAALCALVLYGPSLFLGLDTLWEDLKSGRWSWEQLGKVFGIVSGVVSGAVALFGGFSSKTPANEKEAQQAGVGSKVLSLLTPILAGLFMVFLVMLFSYAAHKLLPALFDYGADTSPLAVINRSTVGRIALLGALIIAAGLLMGFLISTNRFSLHYMWRNRIIRAYLGASHLRRKPNLFTGFDSGDNIPMHRLVVGEGSGELKRKLFHVLNFALNLAGGGRLDWQDRKAESFTASPLHCGSFQPSDRRLSPEGAVGYRPSEWYTAGGGITLGTSVAISGAFVSPNMGYMMTSPVVRFLMTLFNVRFGWWLGNPRNKKTYRYDSPALSVLPIVQEAFGMTNDTSSYVYLSDGGHFENLGLYEMVARRCHFIVASDASTDDDYSFGSLGMAVRQIRVDLGIPIEFDDFAVVGAREGKDGRACAVGHIRYSCVDPGAPDGVLVYVKPTLTGKEPRDVLNYARDNQSFPQEVIVDQWFSEAQFESYRALGSYIVNDLTGGDSRRKLTFEQFEAEVRKYIARTAPKDGVADKLSVIAGILRAEEKAPPPSIAGGLMSGDKSRPPDRKP